MLRAIDHFDVREALQDEKDKQRTKWFIAAREQRERKIQNEERLEDDFMDLASSVILATEIEVQEFQAQLDIYDEATVKALMENQKALDAINEKIEEKFKDGHIMDDGRKVLKSDDGTWAIDEEGERLDSRTHDMDAIPETRVKADDVVTDIKKRDGLRIERQRILDYQEKLDNARERSASDDFTKEELDTLDKELEAEMPMAVKRQMPDYDPAQETNLKSDFDSSAELSLSEIPKQVINQTIAPTLN